MTAFTNRKKIRGWRKQTKKINKWFNSCKKPNINSLSSWRDAYIKIWIDPWYRLEKRNPPLWYFRKILDKLQLMYEMWDKEFSQGEYPYDLQLWIYENKIINSELVCARVDVAGEKRTNYFMKCDEVKDFPTEKFRTDNFNPSEFSWEVGYAANMQYQTLDNLTESEIEKLLRKGYKEEVIFLGEESEQKMYWKPFDYVWIGRKKK